MNKKILISLSVIGVVAAIAIGGTIAYFSDTETSTGNTFTAGELDLIVDINGNDQNPLTQTLFDLTDMKPGDKGEVTISLKVDDNPACGRVSIDLTEDKDNSCTEPEVADDPDQCTTPENLGELNDEVNFLIWKDNGGDDEGEEWEPCNNVLDADETPLVSGPLTGGVVYSISDLPVTPDVDCYGIAYCFGTWNLGDMTCDGSAVNNASQSDSFKADLIIEALQKRHQFPNGCPLVGVWSE